jgi:hypothetical protein
MELGEFTGQGFIKGIGSMISDVKGISTEMAASAVPSVNPSKGYDFGVKKVATPIASPQKVELTIPFYVNGQKFAEATHRDIGKLIKQSDVKTNRLGGLLE